MITDIDLGGGSFVTIEANGLSFEVLTAGTGDHLALCLHGFPDYAISWRNQIPVLVDLGYRVWAPNQRGYGRTTRLLDVDDYDVEYLMDDVAALIDASGARSVTLIGHDWGAAVAWLFAIRKRRTLERLVIMNVPHPALFTRALQHSRKQQMRSWYAAFFQLPKIPEFALGRDRARAIGRMFTASACDRTQFPKAVIDVYRAQASEPGALTAMLNWYRAAARGGMLSQMRLGMPVIEVPTLLLWGEEDVALGKETSYGTHAYVRDLTITYLPGASHWVQQDAPDRVNASLRAFVGRAQETNPLAVEEASETPVH